MDKLALYQHVAANIPDHVSIVDRDYVYLLVNDAYLRGQGKLREAIEGHRVADLFGRELFESSIKPRLDRCFAGEVVSYADWFPFAVLGRRYMSVIYTPYLGDDGSVAGAIVSARDATEQHLVQEALQESEANYRSLFENMLHGYAYCRLLYEQGEPVDFIYLRVNQAFESLTGLRDVVGRPVSEVIPGVRDGNPELLDIYSRVAKTGRPERFETRVSGLDRWFSVSVFCPGPDHFVAIFDNITECHRVQEQLFEATQMLKTVIDTVPHFVFWKDRQFRYLGANRAFARLAGLADPQELVGKNDYDFEWRAFARLYQSDDAQVMDTESPKHNIIEPLDVGNGSVHWLETNKEPLRDALGRVIGVLGIFQDVTERIQSEEKLRQAAKVFESTTEGVMIADAEGNIIAVNRAFSEITGYAEAEILGKNPSQLKSSRHGADFYQGMWTAILESGRWQGEIWNRRKNGEVYPEWLTINTVKDQAGRTINYVGVFSDISLVKQSEAKLNYLAHHDPLTGLPNRLLFNDRLEHAIQRAKRESGLLAVLFIDLDHFKTVNDSLGHPIGDQLLCLVAKVLTECVRAEDSVARLGGDEFVLLLEGLTDIGYASDLARKIQRALVRPHVLEGHALVIGASIGISTYPADGEDATTLLRNADTAMYHSKEDGRNTFRYYSAELTRSARERLTLEAELRQAIERQEFELHYQPQLDVATGAIIGAEALVRWRHPHSGLISPLRFIPLAEETGLILPLGEWVLYTACEQYQAWQQRGLPPFTLAVNLSPRQFKQKGLVQQVHAILDATGMPANHLELEITEGAIMERGENARAILLALKSLGIKLAIDDFGTGYSSLAYLRRFPINVLKIDQSFMRDIPHDKSALEIAATIIAMARNLNMKVLAEGVETGDQLAFLMARGCDYSQGYLHSRPLMPDDFEALLRNMPTLGGLIG